MSFDVAVITINFNSSQLTLRCIEALFESIEPGLSIQVIVVDNNSCIDDYNALKSLVKNQNVTLVRNKINSGFSSANMLGLQFANADYYFFLNNDCIVQKKCLNELKKFADKTPCGALFSPQLIDSKGRPQPSFDFFPEISSKLFGKGIFVLTRNRQNRHSRKVTPADPIEVEVISGSQLFVRATAFHLIGGFDTTFFLYCEEEDLALRVKKAHLKTYIVPTALNYHLGGGSTIRSRLIEREFLISYNYLYRKHYGFWRTQMLRVLLIARYIKKSFRDPKNLYFVFFVLAGSPLSHSLRNSQTMCNDLGQ